MHTDAHHVADLDLQPNEASGLLRVADDQLLGHFGWDRAFWSVLDEVDVADCVALIGHRDGAEPEQGWQIHRLSATRHGDGGRADDAEALAPHDGWVYLFGSHHGGKDGPIRRREQWVARFDESAVVVEDDAGVPGASLEVVSTAFSLHRLVNDALADADVALLPMGAQTSAAFIDETVDRLRDTPDEGGVRAGDFPINIEGAEITPSGALLVGLRYPVSADGCPLVVQLDSCAALFDGRLPAVEAVWEVEAVGRNGELAGVRDLCLVGDRLHLITGDLDSAGKGSVIRADHPGGRSTVSTHYAAPFTGGTGGGRLHAEPVREFPDHPRIEGIAADGEGQFFYVSDEDEAVRLHCTPLLAG